MTWGSLNIESVNILQARFCSDPGYVKDISAQIVASIRHLGLSAEDLDKIQIILAEVINNITEHAYQDCPDQEIEVLVAKCDQGICFHFIDSGIGLPNGQIPESIQPSVDREIADLPEGGFGWFLISTLADNVRYDRKHGQNHLFFRLPTEN